MSLFWLPQQPDWNAALLEARKRPAREVAPRFVALANTSIDFLQTAKLDKIVQQCGDDLRAALTRTRPMKLALLGSSTLTHLVPAIRMAALRRGFWLDVFEGDYGMYHHELADPSSALYTFQPDVVLLALDAQHIAGGNGASAEHSLANLTACWKLAQEQLGATVIQQTVLPVFAPLLGNNEQRFPLSPFSIVAEVNHRLRQQAPQAGVHLLSLDTLTQDEGLKTWHDPALWHRSKQEVSPRMAPLYGDHVGRLLAALRGLSYKCLVLDLDNTLWGGVIGDDGLEGILLGQGHAVGEAHTAFQHYAKELAGRGVILAVCSKNDDANARAAFERHPEMLLRIKDIACFIANWQDKATNLRTIAETLNIGLDSLVFADDNPFERNLIRQELPMVAVPELPEDPALYASTIAGAGYFESLSVNKEDLERGQQYQLNAERNRLRESSTDMAGFLRGLEMQLIWSPFDSVGLSRITQLINKSNQFNLTTRRYTETEVAELIGQPECLTLQLRLTDRFGDNGIIAIIIGRPAHGSETDVLELDTWLMSCRVLGRQVEEATLELIVKQAKLLGARRIAGFYLPTAKNGMVKDHYGRLGFLQTSLAEDGSSSWILELKTFEAKPTFIQIVEGTLDHRTDLREAH
jgi:FkbH-like protein